MKIWQSGKRSWVTAVLFVIFAYLVLVYETLQVRDRAGVLCNRLIREDGPVVARVETMNWLRHRWIVRKIVVTAGDDIGVYYWSGIASAILIRAPGQR